MRETDCRIRHWMYANTTLWHDVCICLFIKKLTFFDTRKDTENTPYSRKCAWEQLSSAHACACLCVCCYCVVCVIVCVLSPCDANLSAPFQLWPGTTHLSHSSFHLSIHPSPIRHTLSIPPSVYSFSFSIPPVSLFTSIHPFCHPCPSCNANFSFPSLFQSGSFFLLHFPSILLFLRSPPLLSVSALQRLGLN